MRRRRCVNDGKTVVGGLSARPADLTETKNLAGSHAEYRKEGTKLAGCIGRILTAEPMAGRWRISVACLTARKGLGRSAHCPDAFRGLSLAANLPKCPLAVLRLESLLLKSRQQTLPPDE